MLPDDVFDRLTIRGLIEDWVVLRDARLWEGFRKVWHPDGVMNATWFEGSNFEEFITTTQQGFDRGVRISHLLGGTSIELSGRRAVAQSKMTISQRATVDGVLCDVVCTGRFYDFFEKRGSWGLVLRQPIYEKDRLDPVDPDAALVLDHALLERFPEGYRHLAYLQTRIGYTVKTSLPGLAGPELDVLYAAGVGWLRGEKLNWGQRAG
jgi:hypothetical protein